MKKDVINNMKNKKTIAIIIALIVLIILVGIYFLTEKSSSDAAKFKEEYETLNGTIREKDGKTIRSITIPINNPMVYATEDEVVEMINNKETFLIYFGFEDCPWCRSILPNLIKAANDLKLNKIYYVNIKDIRDTIELKNGKLTTTKEGSEGYYQLLELLDNVLDDYAIQDEDNNTIYTEEKRIFAPNIVAIINGNAEKMTDGISEEQTDGYMELTKSMNQESYDYFKCIINCIMESEKTCPKEKTC